MKAARLFCFGLGLVSWLRLAQATEIERLSTLFPQEADVYVAGDGLARLDVPAAVLSACQADLSDVRIFDRQRREVAYAIDAGAPIEQRQAQHARVLDVERSEVRRESAPPLRREVYRITVPEDAPENGSWDLEVVTAVPRFVRQLRIDEVLEGGERVQVLASRSLFRRSDGTSKTAFAVGQPTGDLEVTIEGEEGDYLDPQFVFTSMRQLDRMLESQVEVDVLATHYAEGRTILTLARDPGVVPQRLRVESSTPWFDREVVVWEERTGHTDRRLATGRLRRFEGNRNDEQLEIAIDRPHGERLRVEINDGDSPALAAISVHAVVRRPSLIFAIETAEADGPAATLRFGGGRAHVPRYDVSSLMTQGSAELAAGSTAAVRLLDRRRLAAATLGPIRSNPVYDPKPILGFAMRPGTAVEAQVFAASRRLRVQPSADGAARLRLQVDDVTQSLAELADVRVVDAQNRQWPYVIDHNVPPQLVDLQVEPGDTRDQVSTYRFRPEVAIRLESLVLTTATSLLDRPFALTAQTRKGQTILLARDRWRRGPDEAEPLQLSFGAIEVESLELRVEDGDNEPLLWSKAQAQVRLPALVLIAPAGEYRLLVGYADALPPRYDVEALSELVFSVESGTVEAEALVANPEFSRLARLKTGAGARTTAQQLALWGALVLATLVLGGITLRIVRNATPPAAG